MVSYRAGTALCLGQSPLIRFLVLVKQGLYLLLLLAFADLVRVGDFEELRSDLNQPFRLDSGNIVAVLPGRQHKFVVHDPLWVAIEESGGRVDINWRALDESLVSLLGVLLGSITEKARADGLPNDIVIASCGQDFMLVPNQELAKHSEPSVKLHTGP